MKKLMSVFLLGISLSVYGESTFLTGQFEGPIQYINKGVLRCSMNPEDKPIYVSKNSSQVQIAQYGKDIFKYESWDGCFQGVNILFMLKIQDGKVFDSDGVEGGVATADSIYYKRVRSWNRKPFHEFEFYIHKLPSGEYEHILKMGYLDGEANHWTYLGNLNKK